MIAAMSLFAAIARASSGRSSTRGTIERGEHAEDHDDDHDLDQREARAGAAGARRRGEGRWHRPIIMRAVARVLRAIRRRARSPARAPRPHARPLRPLCSRCSPSRRRGRGWFAWRAYTRAAAAARRRRSRSRCAPGASLSAVARELGAAGVLPQPVALVALARWRGVDRTIKAGSYEIEAGHHAAAAARQAHAGRRHADVARRSSKARRSRDLKRALREKPDVRNTVLDLPGRRAHGEARRSTAAAAEGLFFPDTYFFAAGSTDVAILDARARAHGDAARRRVGAARAPTCRSRRPTRR